MRRSSLATLLVAVLSLTALAACGSSGGTESTATSSPSPSATVTCVPKADVTIPKANPKPGTNPDIAKPTGSPPCTLVKDDLTVGSGKAVTDINKTYLWNYQGVSWSTGETFDSSFERGQPIPFSLSQVIPGWTRGLIGMKPGGRRELVIPPDLAYGSNPPAGSGIAPGETLVFVVDLVGPAPSQGAAN